MLPFLIGDTIVLVSCNFYLPKLWVENDSTGGSITMWRANLIAPRPATEQLTLKVNQPDPLIEVNAVTGY